MWRILQEDPPYLIFIREINSYEIYVTDYVSIWFVYFKKQEFLECLKQSNFGLEVESEEMIQKGISIMKNPTGLRKMEVEKIDTLLNVTMSKLLEYPLRLKLSLSEGTKEMFFQNVTHTLLKTVADLQASQQELRKLLKKKDDEIEEYKCEGKEIALRYLKTKQFNDEDHMKQHQAHEECAQLINIPGPILDKVAARTTRNESMCMFCADAIQFLNQVVRQYIKRRIPVYACFLELKKNAKKVSYDRLWSRLKLRNSPPEEIVVTLDYFYKKKLNRKFRTGLFNPILHPLFERLSKYKIGCFINNGKRRINHIGFFDNLMLFGPSLGTIMALVSECDTYSKNHGFRFNPSSSKLLIFQCPRGPKVTTLLYPISLYGVPLDRVTSFNYLGYRFSEYLSDNDDFSDMDSDEFTNSEE